MTSEGEAGRASTEYGLVRLRCPDGHTVGRVMITDKGRRKVVDGEFVSRDYRRHPLAVRCVRCERGGKRRDLRGSWDKAFRLAADIQRDPSRGTGFYDLGG